ncbi:MAG: DUF58 domain-containing protein [Candidatus Hydrogenedentota bacterium]
MPARWFKGRSTRRAKMRVLFAGLAFMFMTVLALAAAWNTGNQLLYIIFGTLVSFQIISYVWTRFFSLRGILMRRESPHAVHRGEPFWVRVRLENTRRLTPAFGIHIENSERRGQVTGFVRSLPAGRAAEVNIREVFPRRGVYQVPPYDLVCSYPFGLHERTFRLRDDAEVLVYPQVHSVRAASVAQFSSGGQIAAAASGDGDEFHTLREYVVGDDLRRIAWKVSARVGTWVVREMTRERSRYVIFVLDTRDRPDVPEFDERFEEAIEIVASLAVSLLRRHYNVAFLAPGTKLEGGEGVAHENRLLDTLARLEPAAPDTDFEPDYAVRSLDVPWANAVHVSPDPSEWGARHGSSRRVLDPREVVYA